MKIQISSERIIKDALTVWDQHGPNVDVVMDPKNLSFRPGSVKEIFALHVLDHLFPEEAMQALKNWHQCLEPGGSLYVLVDDFEYLARAFVGGDFTIELFNQMHNHPMQFTKEYLVEVLKRTGIHENNQTIWYESIPDLLPKKHYEILIVAKKHE